MLKNVKGATKVGKSTKAAIDDIAAKVEKKKKKQWMMIGAVVGALCLCVMVAVMIAVGGKEGTFTSASNGNTEVSGTNGTNIAGSESMNGITELDASLTYYADMEIEDYGTITIQLDQKSAPISAANFVSLAENGFYDGLTFHRIMEGFMMQGGDPNGNGTGGSGTTIVGEFAANGYENNLSHTRGAVSMARADDYDSASSQFFIVHKDSTELDGKYAVFGYVTEGIEIVDSVCEAAEPTNNNGKIPAKEQPVIKTITIRTEE